MTVADLITDALPRLHGEFRVPMPVDTCGILEVFFQLRETSGLNIPEST